MRRPAREVYVRISRQCNRVGLVCEPGLEYRPGDDFDFMTGLLYDICVKADNAHARATPMELAERTAEIIGEVYPDRAYFVEAHDEDGWVQIFQPYGIPKNELSRFATARSFLGKVCTRAKQWLLAVVGHLEPVSHQINCARGEVGDESGVEHRARTHCPYGHAYTFENTIVKKTGYRNCRACENARARQRRS